MTLRVAGAARATTGTRAKQEDAFAIWPSAGEADVGRGEGLLAVVADGMGGHAGGEVAGRLACEVFVAAFSGAEGPHGARLGAALEAANGAIAARAAGDARLHGMGTTLTAAWIDAAGLRWASVGDSLLLLFRAPEVLRLNADHSLGAFLDDRARRREISATEAEKNPYRNALRSALTGKAIEIVDLRSESYPLAEGDWLILASDGIAALSGDEIGDLVYANRHAGPEQMADGLIAAVLAKEIPDQDNTTVLVVKVGEHAANVAADEAPTRVLRASTGPVTALLSEADGVETTQRMVPPAAAPAALLRRHRTALLALAMASMFAVGWLLRAWLE
jgi:serine/threonine protein phosphatase PrpC